MKANINGITLNYTLDGPEDAPVVLMSHSLMCGTAMWDQQMVALSAYRVLRVDTRGHGQSEASVGPYSLEDLAGDFVGLLDHLGIEKVHFVGLSMGGMIGQVLGVSHADRVLSLTLCDTMCEVPESAGGMWQERINQAETLGVGAMVDGTIERWFSGEFCARRPDLVNPIRELIRTTPLPGFIGCCHAISRLNMTSRLASITTPTLVIVGKDDLGTPVSAAQQIQQNIPGAELVIIDDALHLSNMEQPEVFNKALTGFLSRH